MSDDTEKDSISDDVLKALPQRELERLMIRTCFELDLRGVPWTPPLGYPARNPMPQFISGLDNVFYGDEQRCNCCNGTGIASNFSPGFGEYYNG